MGPRSPPWTARLRCIGPAGRPTAGYCWEGAVSRRVTSLGAGDGYAWLEQVPGALPRHRSLGRLPETGAWPEGLREPSTGSTSPGLERQRPPDRGPEGLADRPKSFWRAIWPARPLESLRTHS